MPKILQPGSGVQLPKTVVPEGTDTWSRIFASHPNKETDHGVNGDTR